MASAPPAGGAGAASVPIGLENESRNKSRKARHNEYTKKVESLHEVIKRKPIFLIATHGEYTKENIAAPVDVPDGAIIIELSTIGEVASCDLGAYGSSFRNMLTPDKLPDILTADRGKTIKDPNELVLHNSAKYMGGMYYERYLTLSPSNNASHFYIQKIHNNKTVHLEYIEKMLRKKIKRSREDPGMNLNEVIRTIFDRDEDAYEDGGIFIIATCGVVDDSGATSNKDISRITAYQESHRILVERLPSRFRFEERVTLHNIRPPRPHLKYTRKKATAPQLLIHEQVIPFTILKDGTPKEIKVGVHSRVTRGVGANNNANNSPPYIAPPEGSYMIKVGPAIYHKHGKVVFSKLEMQRIIKQLKIKATRLAIPTIELYNASKRKWATVYIS